MPPSLSSLPSIAPPPPTRPPTPLPLLPSSSFSPFSSLSLSSPACRFLPPPSPPALSFPAKRLAGVFSTVVTFKTECHHCLSCSLSSLPLTCFSPVLLPLARASPIPPSSSCSEGLLDQVLCLEESLALIQLSSICVWAVCVLCGGDGLSSTSLTHMRTRLLILSLTSAGVDILFSPLHPLLGSPLTLPPLGGKQISRAQSQGLSTGNMWEFCVISC